jgi:hypothetical protein
MPQQLLPTPRTIQTVSASMLIKLVAATGVLLQQVNTVMNQIHEKECGERQAMGLI